MARMILARFNVQLPCLQWQRGVIGLRVTEVCELMGC